MSMHLPRALTIMLVGGVLSVASCHRNQPPDKPDAPDGPTSGEVGSVYTFTTVATDPDGQLVAVKFDWDDGDTSDWTPFFPSGAEVTENHLWSLAGNYRVSVQAKDAKDLVSAWSNSHDITIVDTVNLPPRIPAVPTGPDSGYVDSIYGFTAASSDTNGDRVRIQFRWSADETDTSETGALVSGGTQVTMFHFWPAEGEFSVSARAKDEKGLVSDWSAPHVFVAVDSF